jgi:hypothetical protein
MPNKDFSKSFKQYFQREADYAEGIWEMDYLEELDEDLASNLSEAMSKVEWKTSKSPQWHFASLVPGDNEFKPLQFNQNHADPDFLISIEFNGVFLCPRLISWDQNDKMAGLFGWAPDYLEKDLKTNFTFDFGVDIGNCVELALKSIFADRKAGFELYGIPKPMQSLACGPEVILYFYGLLSKSLGYAFYENGQKGLLENHMDFYKDCQEMWIWFTKETSKQGQDF